MLITQQLDLDVPRMIQIALKNQTLVAECAGRLAPRSGDRLGQLTLVSDEMHALAAPARAWLDQHRIADAFCLAGESRVGLVVAVVPGQHGHAQAGCQLTRRGLVAQRAHCGRRRPDPGDAGIDDGLREIGVLGQESIAGMDRIRARSVRSRQDRGGLKVRTLERHYLVGRMSPPRARLVLGNERQTAYAELPAGARDTDH